MSRLEEIRSKERDSHIEAYTSYALYEEGSWLKKPIKTVLDLLPWVEKRSQIRVLDLGCGVGRNCIAIAQYFQDIDCQIDCIDILELAIEKLNQNAALFDVAESVHGIITPIEMYSIKKSSYDLILAVSALEHVDSEQSFVQKLEEIRDGTRDGGIVCLIVNSDVIETNKKTGQIVPAQFEVNLSKEVLEKMVNRIFVNWKVLKSGFRAQQYDIPRGNFVSDLHTQVMTFVARKE